MNVYCAVLVQQDSSKRTFYEQIMLNLNDLPANDVLIKVNYTALNYNDALILSGKDDGISYPVVPGIDASGIIVSSKVAHFNEGDEVFVTGLNLSSKCPGGFGGYISAPADLVLPIPIGYDLKSCMTLGSASITAGIGSMNLTNTGLTPNEHKLAVTNASCDLGAVTAAILAVQGYNVTAYVYEPNDKDYVLKLGVSNVLPMSQLENLKNKTLEPPLYDGAFDTVGGNSLSTMLKLMNPNSTVIVAGERDDMTLYTSLMPFLHRGLNLIGINALSCSPKIKRTVWQKLSSDWRIPQAAWLCTEISFEELANYVPLLLQGKVKGRLVINHSL
ncbi:MAG: alcohol dehydrogenase catalytic domain-containing protein [Deferribacteraceae bacterium]|jgi:putative YhdH/YhfP family quinone oxidoreductase|nr:alcohol dehydrogenase catalytic domain-containing protein [Deferribacteraceae bacterium]